MQRTQTNPRSEIVPVLRVVVAKEGGMTNSYELAQGTVRFGRSPEADVRLEGKNISRVHCILEVRQGNLWVRDNDSLNGIFVNGEKVKEAIVTARDGVKVGPYRFKAIITGTTAAPRPEPRAVVPASASREELDRTLPAFDAKKAALKDGPLPKDEPLHARPSTSASVVLEEFALPVMGTEDKTPADGTPAASPAQAIAPVVKAAEVAPVAAPVAKPSYRSSFESASAKRADAPVVKKAEAPKLEAPVKAEAPRAPVPQRGRMSLTNPGAKRSTDAVKAGDLCPSCSTGKMLTWQGALKCRSCGNTAEIGATASSSSSPSIVSARPSIAPRTPAASRPSVNAAASAPKASASETLQIGELCGSCYKGRMLTWQGALKCRSCGNTAEIGATATSSSSPAIRARPSIAPRMPAASRPSVVTNPAANAPKASAAGTLQIGELCGDCYKGRMLTWEGALKCRSCGNTAAIGNSTKSVEAKASISSAKPAAKIATRTASPSREVREPNRTAAAVTGVGLFIGLYVTIGVCTVANMLLL